MRNKYAEACRSRQTLVRPLTVLAPGLGDNENRLRVLEAYLTKSVGPTVTISPQPSDGRERIELLATALAKALVPYLDAGHSISLVGFSMGGLICRYYWQFLADSSAVKTLITIATPHNGTWTAYSLHCPACLQMRPGSQFLRNLNRDLKPLTHLRFTSVWTPLDLTIIPSASSWLPVGEIVTIVSPFHYTLVLDPRVLRAVSARLVH